jgi:hypothetical protein
MRTRYFDDGNGERGILREQDVTPALDSAYHRRRMGAVGSNEMRHAAHFPAVAVERYCNLRGITFEEFMASDVHVKAMMADPDLAGFRVWEGKV